MKQTVLLLIILFHIYSGTMHKEVAVPQRPLQEGEKPGEGAPEKWGKGLCHTALALYGSDGVPAPIPPGPGDHQQPATRSPCPEGDAGPGRGGGGWMQRPGACPSGGGGSGQAPARPARHILVYVQCPLPKAVCFYPHFSG